MENKSNGILKISALLIVSIAVMFVVNLLCAPIIEKNNGNISVESSDNKTIFTIKYFK